MQSTVRPNARSEGYNRIVRHVGRTAFGFRSPEPTLPGTLGLHPPNTVSATQNQAPPQLSRKSRYYYHVGREDEITKRPDESISDGEVRSVLEQLTCIREAAVLGEPDRWGEEIPVAVVVPHPGNEQSVVDIARRYLARLCNYTVPEEFHVVGTFPRTAVNKIEPRSPPSVLIDADESKGESS